MPLFDDWTWNTTAPVNLLRSRGSAPRPGRQ